MQDCPETAFGGSNWDSSKAAPVRPMRQLFVIDVSIGSQHAIPYVAKSLRAALTSLASAHPDNEVAFITYASSVCTSGY